MHLGQLKHVLAIFLITVATVGVAQDNMSAVFKRSLYDADKLFEDENYLRALAVYDSLWDLRPNDIYLQYKTGICYIYKSTGRDKAYDILKEIVGVEGYKDVMFYLA